MHICSIQDIFSYAFWKTSTSIMSSCFGKALLACLALSMHQTRLSYWRRISIWHYSGEGFSCINELQHPCHELLATLTCALRIMLIRCSSVMMFVRPISPLVSHRWLLGSSCPRRPCIIFAALDCLHQDDLIIGSLQQDIRHIHRVQWTYTFLVLPFITSVLFGSSTQLHRIFLPWGAAPSNCTPIALQIIYILLHHLVSYETTSTDNGKFYAKRPSCTSSMDGEQLLPATIQYFINLELPRCFEMNRERLPVHLQCFYCHLVVGEYQCDISSYPSELILLAISSVAVQILKLQHGEEIAAAISTRVDDAAICLLIEC